MITTRITASCIILVCALLSLAGCDLLGAIFPGPEVTPGTEAGAWCRMTADGIVKLLVLSGDGVYSVLDRNPVAEYTEVKVFRDSYEITEYLP